MRILGKASGALLLAFGLAGAAVWSVKADTLTPTGGTQFTDAQFSGVGINGTQTITQGFNTDVLGCPMMSPQPACLDSGTVDILFSGGTADGLIVQGSKFYVDIVGNLSSIFTSYTASGVGVSGTLSSITNIAGKVATYRSVRRQVRSQVLRPTQLVRVQSARIISLGILALPPSLPTPL